MCLDLVGGDGFEPSSSRSRTVRGNGYTPTVLTAFILVESTREGLAHLGSDLAAVEGVAEVYTVTGDWDFVAIVRVREHDDLAKVVTHPPTPLHRIDPTPTLVALPQFSA